MLWDEEFQSLLPVKKKDLMPRYPLNTTAILILYKSMCPLTCQIETVANVVNNLICVILLIIQKPQKN